LVTSSRFAEALCGILPDDRVTTRPETLRRLSRDQTDVLEPGEPVAAAFPITTGEVASIVRMAAAFGVPIVPRGAGSGLSGGAMAVAGCLILSLERMNRLLELSADDMVAVVEPGLITADLIRAADAEGLMYAPDPSSYEISTIGGNVATNAGGLRCVKYGVTRESVLGLEVVLADGTVIRTGRRSVKGVVGYDLTALFVGSGGTLGIVTRATLRLRPRPPASSTLLASFPSLDGVAGAVHGIRSHGVVPSILEIMDRTVVNAVEDWRHPGLNRAAAGILIARSDSSAADLDIAAIAEACRRAGGADILVSSDAVESEALMDARRAALPALERRGRTLLEDIAVPLGAVEAAVRAIAMIAIDHRVEIGTFGHVGDGNLHPTLVWAPGDAEAGGRARRAAEAILEMTIRLGGTVSGEHGVGILKGDAVAAELDVGALDLSRRIKALLDPAGVLNPGKFPSPPLTSDESENVRGGDLRPVRLRGA
jgi:glycolate oxidase